MPNTAGKSDVASGNLSAGPGQTTAVKRSALADIQALQRTRNELVREIGDLRHLKQLGQTRESLEERLRELRAECSALQEQVGFSLYGLYEPVFEMQDHADYIRAIRDIRQAQRKMIRSNTATTRSGTTWLGNIRLGGLAGSRVFARLVLRAFNVECDLIASRVNHLNVRSAKARVTRIAGMLSRICSPMGVSISPQFVALKFREIELAAGEKEKRELEAQRLRRLSDGLSAEKAAQEDIDQEIRRIEKEKAENLVRLRRYRQGFMEAQAGDGLADRAGMARKIAEMESTLTKVIRARGQLALMAADRRIGHVYVISNRAAFGSDMVKIGMTRRVDPQAFIRELGDGAVPFRFDVHAIIFSEDAIALCRQIQAEFEQYRTNRQDLGKDFFSVNPEQVGTCLRRLLPEVRFAMPDPLSAANQGGMQGGSLPEAAVPAATRGLAILRRAFGA